MKNLSKESKLKFLQIALTILFIIGISVLSSQLAWQDEDRLTIFNPSGNNWLQLSLYLLVYVFIGYETIGKAVSNLFRGNMLDESFLMTAATIGALCIGEYLEALSVMLFYQIGELFEDYAVNKSRKSIAQMMDIAPEYANIMEDGQLKQVDPDDLNPGQQIIVLPGERIPLDGLILEGNSTIDTSALTGESLPVDVTTGNQVISGCINQTGRLVIEVTKKYGESTVARILDLVENASDQKASFEIFASSFARYYTPIVILSALAVATLPSLIFHASFAVWLERALIFLVVSCPCAIVVSVPLSFFGGIGAASRIGVLVKGSNYLEYMAKLKTIIFDKTGTLTQGKFTVSKLKAVGVSQDDLLEKAAYAEYYSNHPIAKSILASYDKPISSQRISDVEELSGHGMKIKLDGKVILAGNQKLMRDFAIDYPESSDFGSIVYIAEEGICLGYLAIEDKLKIDSKETIPSLKAVGIERTLMLTGDRENSAQTIARSLQLDDYYAELLPDQKVEKLKAIIDQRPDPSHLIAFVGDGINDAPALAIADVGIAMGGIGSDAAIEAADVVIMQDQPKKIPEAILVARKTLAIVKQNVVFALGVKALILFLATLGYASMWLAVFGDVGVTVLAVFNAMRALSAPVKSHSNKNLLTEG